MVDYSKELVSALKTILPTHYEMELTAREKVPCISYLELNNAATDTGDTVGYSRITYQIKVWGHDLAELQKYAIQIAEVMRPLGFRRISSGELYDKNSSMIQKIMTFEAFANEVY